MHSFLVITSLGLMIGLCGCSATRRLYANTTDCEPVTARTRLVAQLTPPAKAKIRIIDKSELPKGIQPKRLKSKAELEDFIQEVNNIEFLTQAITKPAIPGVDFARVETSQTRNDFPKTTLFEYGFPVEKAEDCMINLLLNYHCVVSDRNEWLQLLSYRYVGVVDSKRKYAKMVHTNIDKTPKLLYSTYSSADEEEMRSYVELSVDKRDYSDKINCKQFGKDTYRHHIGDMAYLLEFSIYGMVHQYYILVNPQTLKVFDMANMWNRPIPVGCFPM